MELQKLGAGHTLVDFAHEEDTSQEDNDDQDENGLRSSIELTAPISRCRDDDVRGRDGGLWGVDALLNRGIHD